MRQFKLINKTGAEFDLMRTDAFLYEPEGLGWGYETDYTEVDDAIIPLDSKLTHPSPSGSMVFDGYAEYAEFLAFIQVGGLVLAYMPLSTWQYLEVSAVLGKSEIKPDTNKLICEIEFDGLSYWYETPIVYASTGGTTGAINNGALSSFCRIEIEGAAVNPVWTLYDSNAVVISSGKVTATIPSGDTLVIDSRPRSMEIAEYDSNGDLVGSVYASSDFSTERFIVIPSGTGYYMTFSDDGGAMGDITVEVFKRV